LYCRIDECYPCSMSRPLRIEYAGALYHVTSRGDRREKIYEDGGDRSAFLVILSNTVDRYGWLCHGYCLMDNHYHLIIETPHANLGQGMRQLNGVYTQTYNRNHTRVGHVFQGRYKAILVDKDSYFLELARYVELNPVRAQLVKQPRQWQWSSYRARVGETAKPKWLTTEEVLSCFGKQKLIARQRYAEFVKAGVKQPTLWKSLNQQIYLGDESFIKKQLRKLNKQERDKLDEIPRQQRENPVKTLSQISQQTKDRKRAMVTAYRTGAYSQKQIADYFEVHYSTVSRAIKAFE